MKPGEPQPQINFEKIPTTPEEPLRAELGAFSRSVRNRRPPRVDGAAGRAALELADRVMAGIQEHARRVQLDAERCERFIYGLFMRHEQHAANVEDQRFHQG